MFLISLRPRAVSCVGGTELATLRPERAVSNSSNYLCVRCMVIATYPMRAARSARLLTPPRSRPRIKFVSCIRPRHRSFREARPVRLDMVVVRLWEGRRNLAIYSADQRLWSSTQGETTTRFSLNAHEHDG